MKMIVKALLILALMLSGCSGNGGEWQSVTKITYSSAPSFGRSDEMVTSEIFITPESVSSAEFAKLAKAVTSGAYAKLPEWIDTSVMDGDIVSITVESVGGVTSKSGVCADTEGPKAFRNVCKQIKALAENARQSAGTPLFEFMGESGIAFAEDFESDFPVSVSVAWYTVAGGEPIVSTDADVIQAVFDALRGVRVGAENGYAHTDDELRYWFTMKDGSNYGFGFQSGCLIMGNEALRDITGFGAVDQAFSFLPPEPTPGTTLSPEELAELAAKEASLLAERLKLTEPLIYPGSVPDDFFGSRYDDIHYESGDDFSKITEWYESNALLANWEIEKDDGWRRYSGSYEGLRTTILLMNREFRGASETSISITFGGE